MISLPDCVRRLADLVGVSGETVERYDWAAIESSLGGLGLPRDYRAFVETFPPREFGGKVSVIRPGHGNYPRSEYLGFYAHRLDDLRGWREKGHGRFPYPIFPEAGGVLPWGRGNEGELYFWLTDGQDPDSWPVVWTDRDKLDWQTYHGTMCEFLIGLLATEEPVPAAPPAARPAGSRPRWGRRLPENQFAELSGVLGGNLSPAGGHDWADLERYLGLSLPTDYREFIDRYGTGTFCDIRITGPDPCPEYDLRALVHREIELAQSSPRARLAFSDREVGAVIAWGETADGWLCGWGAADADPDQWGTAMVSPDFNSAFYDELSFSSFLLSYCGEREYNVFFDRTPWTGGPTFTAHRHG